MNGRDPGDGFFGEDAQLQRKGAGEFAVEIDGAAAHSGNHACVLNLGPFQLDQNDGLPWAQEIVQDSDDFQVELFHLIPGKDRVGVTLHAGAHLAERENLAQFLSGCSLRSQAQGEDEREKGDEQKTPRLGQTRLDRKHQSVMILGGVRGSNRTVEASKIGEIS